MFLLSTKTQGSTPGLAPLNWDGGQGGGSMFTCVMGSKVTVTHGEDGAGVAKLSFCREGVASGGVDPGLSGSLKRCDS